MTAPVVPEGTVLVVRFSDGVPVLDTPHGLREGVSGLLTAVIVLAVTDVPIPDRIRATLRDLAAIVTHAALNGFEDRPEGTT